MTSIRIRIPRTNKEWIYIGEQEVNAARSAGNTTGMAYARGHAFRASLGSVKEQVPTSTNGRYSNLYHNLHIKTAYDDYSSYPFVVGKPEGNVLLEPAGGGLVEIIDAEIDVTRKNTIKETALVHREGTVKELIQANDYDVTITGHLFSDSRTPNSAIFPQEQLRDLNGVLSTKEPLKIISVYTDSFDIHWVVLKSAEFFQSKNKYLNVLGFTLKMVSDTEHTFMED